MTQLSNVLITDNSTIKTNFQWSKHPIIVSFLRQIYVLWDTFNLRCQPYQTFLEASLLCNIKLLCSVLRNHEGWTPFQSWFFFCLSVSVFCVSVSFGFLSVGQFRFFVCLLVSVFCPSVSFGFLSVCQFWFFVCLSVSVLCLSVSLGF